MAIPLIENRTFDEIQIGEVARITRVVTRRDIELFAVVSGDFNPSHLDVHYAEDDRFHGIVVHGMMGAALISAVLGTKLPGFGTIYVAQDLTFLRPVRPDDTIDVSVAVKSKDPASKRVILDCCCTNQNGDAVITGVATVVAPVEKIRRAAPEMPLVEVIHHDRLRALIDDTKSLAPLRTAVVYPCDDVSLQGVDAAAQEKIIKPILVGPADKIRAAAKAAQIVIDTYEIADATDDHAAAKLGVELARTGRADALMKGSLHTDVLMAAVVDHNSGLRTSRRMSHVFVMDVPTGRWPMLITDAALNIAPDLNAKKDICQNAIYLAQDLGLEQPKVALLAAVETINTNMPATIDADALCKMAERGEITGGTLGGPLAFDDAISVDSARIKGITSPVAGYADIFVVPNIEAGNMLFKQLDYLAEAESAGIVLGARVPIILTSRADLAPARLASAALAVFAVAGERRREAAAAAAAKV